MDKIEHLMRLCQEECQSFTTMTLYVEALNNIREVQEQLGIHDAVKVLSGEKIPVVYGSELTIVLDENAVWINAPYEEFSTIALPYGAVVYGNKHYFQNTLLTAQMEISLGKHGNKYKIRPAYWYKIEHQTVGIEPRSKEIEKRIMLDCSAVFYSYIPIF